MKPARLNAATTVEMAFIGLGTNLGDRETALRGALSLLSQKPGVRMVAYSGLYETEPVGVREQPRFLNAVACVQTTLAPERLLDELMAIEKVYGRRRVVRWGPRTLDLDLLLYGGKTVQTPRLTVPHPRLFERPFVLVPLLELEPWLPVTVLQQARQALAACGTDGVKVQKAGRWAGFFD